MINESLALAGIGIVVGSAGAWFGARLLKATLFETSAVDLVVYVPTALLLVAIALVATYLPARRATRLDPTIAMLRQCVAEAAADSKTDPEIKARIESMMLFLEGLTGWDDQVKALPKSTLITLIKMGARVAKFVAKVA